MTTPTITVPDICTAAQAAMDAHIARSGKVPQDYDCGAYDVFCTAIGPAWAILVNRKVRISGPSLIAHIVNYEGQANTDVHLRDFVAGYGQEVMTALNHVTNGEWD